MCERRRTGTLAGRISCAALLVAAVASPAWAAQRVALVIGNADYLHAPALATPLNDAADVGAALERLGFAVTRVENADQVTLLRSVRALATAAEAAEQALVFYVGHAVAVDGHNFLLPTDARLASAQDLEFEAVPLALVERAAQRASGVRLVILDASLESPFVASMREAGTTRSIGTGLAGVEPSAGTLVAYAARADTVAVERPGRNSLYTGTLLRYLAEPGPELGSMFRDVREAVLAATARRQEPAVYGSLPVQEAFLGAPLAGSAERPAAAAGAEGEAGLDQLAAEQLAAERLYWESVQDSHDPAEIQTYLDRYPNGTYAALAQVRRERLLREAGSPSEAAASGPEASAAPGPGAEAQAAPTPTRPALEPPAAEEALGLTRDGRVLIQSGLAALGFDPGPLDGVFGPGTRAAIRQWQASREMPTTGYLEVASARELAEAGVSAPPPAAGPTGTLGLSEAVATTLAQALQAAGRIEDADDRTRAFTGIGVAFAEAGETRRAMQSLELAMTATAGIDGGLDRASRLADIAVAHAEAGDGEGAETAFDEAMAVAAQVEGWYYGKAFRSIARAQARTGDLRGALATASRIEDKYDQAEVLAAIAEARAKDGDAEGAAQAIGQALEAAAWIDDEEDRAKALADIAVAQAEAGDAEGAAQSIGRALEVAAREQWFLNRSGAFLSIARSQAWMGDMPGAMATAGRIEHELYLSFALQSIVRAQTKSGDAEGAAQSIQQALEITARLDADDPDWRSSEFADIAGLQAKAGDLSGAMATAARIEDEDDRVSALANIAGTQAKSGDAKSAAQSLEQASEVAAGIESEDARGRAHSRIANSQAEAGDFGAALATAKRIESEGIRAECLAGIAEAQAEAGDFQGALATVQRIADGSYRAQALISIALAQIKSGT